MAEAEAAKAACVAKDKRIAELEEERDRWRKVADDLYMETKCNEFRVPECSSFRKPYDAAMENYIAAYIAAQEGDNQ
jgi:hypothetical protein